MITLSRARARWLAWCPLGPGAPYAAWDSRHRASPRNPMNSSHNVSRPTAVDPTRRSAPLLSARRPLWPKATSSAIQPMIAYITPRVVSPARASTVSPWLLTARLVLTFVLRYLRRATPVFTVAASLWGRRATPPAEAGQTPAAPRVQRSGAAAIVANGGSVGRWS